MTMWFDKKPGALAALAAEGEEPGAMLIGDAPPDWVRLPTDLGRTQVRVLGSHYAPCPKCSSNAHVRHLDLEGDVLVAECSGGLSPCGFVWYRRPA